MGDICGDNRFEIIKKAKEELLESTNIDTSKDEMKVIDNFLFRCWQMGWLERYDKPREPLDIPTMSTDFIKEYGLYLPNGYEFRDENGNVIEAEKIVLEKKQPEYPKSVEACCEILGYPTWGGDIGYKSNLLMKFQMLLMYRDAYWKLAGDWKPDWETKEGYYCIGNFEGIIAKFHENHTNTILAFPTKEMRDTFYENFKELIEECKELL